MEPEGSLPHSQVLANPEPPHPVHTHTFHYLKIHVPITLQKLI